MISGSEEMEIAQKKKTIEGTTLSQFEGSFLVVFRDPRNWIGLKCDFVEISQDIGKREDQ